MTNKLEKQFFDAFGVDERIEFETCNALDSSYTYSTAIKRYPQITDRILLELICILASNPIRILFESMLSGIKEVELLKNSILLTCITNKDTIKHQVRTLFEEEKWWNIYLFIYYRYASL